jgi:hypothetical protein
MPAKMAQISPLGRRSGCQDYGRRPRRQAVLSKRGNSAKIHPGLGFIWGIPDGMSETAAFRGWKAQNAIERFHGIGRLVTLDCDKSVAG